MSQLTVQVQQAIKSIVESDQEFTVSFDDAWQWLGYFDKATAKRSLVSNFECDVDFSISAEATTTGISANRRQIITLTNDCFKQLAMLAGTAKGKEVRRYFLDCEKELKAIKQAPQPQLPANYLDALKALVASEEEKQQLTLQAAVAEEKVQELLPQAAIYQAVSAAKSNVSMGDVAKVIGVMGRNHLFEFLRGEMILQRDNTPYQQFITAGYFTVVITPSKHQMFTNHTTTLATPKGIEFIIKRLQKAGYSLPQAA
ncbi:MAG: phage antirepressor KilAC domain-containing protein [Oscillatoriophycideae cyanobacterium NC_groundwater_1537_Pr4_S-0.65um_50_18]|nr:phage antirepressor KilAC domain-containing protein [Oscillatoriophycideae cyanobacterium NC_groundwater_1537_Pr4_S-0.65um_50_18]